MAALVVLVVILIVCCLRREDQDRTSSGFGNPHPYAYGGELIARAGAGGPRHGDRADDGDRGHDHGAGGVSRVNFDDNNGYYTTQKRQAGPPERMMNTAHWDQMGTYQHTSGTWGLPTGEGRVNYSGYSKEGMSVGAHWDTDGTYGHTSDTLPSFGLSGYNEDVPTAPWE